MRLGTKPPILHTSARVARALDRLSKSALIDLYTQALAVQLGRADDALTLNDVAADATPTLLARGDRIPAELQR